MTPPDHGRRGAEDPRPGFASEAAASKGTYGSETPPSICVVETVADALEADPTELRPLYEAVEPDALDTLFESSGGFTSGRVTFTFEGCTVTVDADGWVAASPGTDGGA